MLYISFFLVSRVLINIYCSLTKVAHSCDVLWIRALEENTIWNSDILVIQLASMDSSFPLKLLVHGTGLLSLKHRHWLYLGLIFVKISVCPFRIIPWKGPAEYWNRTGKLSGPFQLDVSRNKVTKAEMCYFTSNTVNDRQ